MTKAKVGICFAKVTDSTGATSNHDIDVRITAPGPDFEEIFNVERENDGR